MEDRVHPASLCRPALTADLDRSSSRISFHGRLKNQGSRFWIELQRAKVTVN
jgi:hypothetical protein